MLYFNTKQLTHSGNTLSQNQCKLERTQMLTISMLAMQNTRLAYYILTGNRSIFLNADGIVAWFQPCLKFLSPLRVPDKFNDRIPILFVRTTKIVDSVIRQTFDFVSEVSCLGDCTNEFQVHLENDKSWYQLLPDLLMNLCCSSQLNLEILRSLFLSKLVVLEGILPSTI